MPHRSVLALSLVALAAACAPRSSADVEALAAEVATLRAQVDELRTFQQRVEMAVDLPEDPATEMAALDLAYEARDKLIAGDNAAAKELLQRVVEDYPDTQVAPAAREMLSELRIIGSDAGELDVAGWVQGEYALPDEGTTVLVFFEAWCPHCKREMPNLQDTFERLDDDGLDVVGLTSFSRGTSDEDMERFLDTAGVTFPVARDDGTLSSRFLAQGVPHAAVVKDGAVAWIGHPSELADERLKAWLAE